jgi:hypothetical protein
VRFVGWQTRGTFTAIASGSWAWAKGSGLPRTGELLLLLLLLAAAAATTAHSMPHVHSAEQMAEWACGLST